MRHALNQDRPASACRPLSGGLGALVVAIALAVPACGPASGNGGSGAPTASDPASGLSALYPGDVNIESHPDVLFVERFEEPTLAALFGRWTDVRNGAGMAWSTDVPPGSPGTHSLNIPWVGGGVSDGGHLYKQLSPGVDDTLYVRYYIKYPTSGTPGHTGIWFGGYDPPLGWPNPQAGVKPAGSDRFSAAAEHNSLTSRFDHYDYWMNMHQSADGNNWGNLLLNSPSVQANLGGWTCVEHMVKLNNPVTSFNGEHAIWLNGVKVSHLGQGFPKGSWSGGIFTQDPAGSPFEGFRWRSDPSLNLNYIWLQNYSPHDPAGFSANMYFDHVVAARSYIGCLPALASSGASATRSSPRKDAWPNEPKGLVPFNDQPWDRVARSDVPIRGRVGRLFERVRAMFSPAAEGGPEWRYLRRTSSKDATIVEDVTAPRSPASVLRIVYTPDMRPDSEPSVHWIPLPQVKEVYTGWWIKLSSNWIPNAAGGGKITFLWTTPDGNGQVYTNLYHHGGDEVVGWVSGPPYRIGANTEWAPYGQKIWLPNVATTFVNPGEWHRIEFYYRWGSPNGIIRWWVDEVLNGDYTNVAYPAGGLGFNQFEFAPTVQVAGPAERYMYIDHTYVSIPPANETGFAPGGRQPLVSARQ